MLFFFHSQRNLIPTSTQVHCQEININLFSLYPTTIYIFTRGECGSKRGKFSSNANWEAQLAQDPPATQETQVQSLGQKDPLEMEMATYSSILAWEIPWTEESGGLTKELDMTEWLSNNKYQPVKFMACEQFSDLWE